MPDWRALSARAGVAAHGLVGWLMWDPGAIATPDQIVEVRDASIEPGLDDIAPGLTDDLRGLATALWRGVDAVHFGFRPLFAAHRALPRADPSTALAAWQAVNCLRELRGDNHWALCASEDLDAVEVGLLHSAMVDIEEYGSEEWIARSRGNDDAAIAAGWRRLEAKGFAREGLRRRPGGQDGLMPSASPAWAVQRL